MEKLLYWCAGVDLILIHHASPQDRGRYAMLGVFILFTATLSGLSMYFIAAYLTTDPVLCAVAALFWSGFIFSVDRYLSISITSFKAHLHPGDHSKDTHKPASQATSGYLFAVLTRLLVALFISVVISIPVKLALFEKDINGYLAGQNRHERANYFTRDPELQALKQERETGSQRINSLTQLIQNAERQVIERYQDMKNELDGTGSSGKPGFGPYYEQAQNAYAEAKQNVQQARQQYNPEIDRLRTRDGEIIRQLNHRLAELQQSAATNNGLLRRYQALSGLAQERHEVSFSLWLISALFVFIESFPVLTKASSKRDSYELVLVKLAQQRDDAALNIPVSHPPNSQPNSDTSPHSNALSTLTTNPILTHNATLIPNQYRSYLILLGVGLCLIFPFVYRYVHSYTDSFTPTLILYMFSPISILLAFLVTELLALRSRTLWQCLRPDEDLNFSLQALVVLLAPVSVILYLLLKPVTHTVDGADLLILNRQPLFDHGNFWIGWCLFSLIVLYGSYRTHLKDSSTPSEKNTLARQQQIQELENRVAQGQQAYRNSIASLYSLAAACALCSFVLCIQLATALDRQIFWILHCALMSIPAAAVLLASSGLRIPITAVLSIANSRLKRLYTLIVVFVSATATAMCLLLLLSQLHIPPEPHATDNAVMNEPVMNESSPFGDHTSHTSG
ncbi:MAG: DUF4407 domain-containing protein [Gammaproteobacteria bacterium]